MLEEKGTYQEYNRIFPLVKNYVYEKEENLEELGLLKNSRIGNSVYILQDREKKNIAYRIYRTYRRKNTNDIREASFQQNLLEYGKDIKDIDFPYGVITKDNHIIGQVIPFYEDKKELVEEEKPYPYLLESYQLIKELYEHGIYYIDIHGRNFLIEKNHVKLIDFDPNLVIFQSKMKMMNHYYHRQIAWNFSRMAQTLLRDNYDVDSFDRVDTLKDLENVLLSVIEKPKVKKK